MAARDESLNRRRLRELSTALPLLTISPPPVSRQQAIANIKRAAYEGSQMKLEDGLAFERDLIEQLFRSNDAREGLTAFTEKRAAAFTGA